MRRRLLLLAPLLLGCATTPPAPPRPATEGLEAQVVADPRRGTLEVTVEARGSFPARWLLESPRLVRKLEARDAAGWRPLEPEEAVEVAADVTGLRWVYAVAEGGGLRSGRGAPGGYSVHGRAYLGRPDPVPACPLTIRWRDRAGEPARPLIAWAIDARGETRVQASALYNPGFHAFGGRRHTVKLVGGRLEVAILPGPLQRSDRELLVWLRQAAEEVQRVRDGTFPHPRIPVVLIPSRARGGDVVPFGTVEWSDPQSVALLVRGNATRGELRHDWVAVHELMHLTHPCFQPRAPWLSEGAATYYQTVGRLRSGRRTPQDMWGGFRSGVAHGARYADASLAELSANLRRTHAYPSVYWGGALLLLDADLRIRNATQGRRSLDDVFARLLRQGSTSSVAAFGAMVDAVAGRRLWPTLVEQHLQAPLACENAERVFERCGVAGSEDAVRLLKGPEGALRRAIAAGRR